MDGSAAATWRARIGEQKKSGRSVPSYCAWRGLSTSSFYKWRKRLEMEDRPRARFLPVRVVEEERHDGTAAGVEVVLGGGRRIEVRRGFDADTLLAVVTALEAAPC